MSVAMRHGIVSAVGRVAAYPVMLAGECERASDCKPPMPWSERGWAPTGPSWSGRALTCRTGHCSFVTDGDNSTSVLHAISAVRRADGLGMRRTADGAYAGDLRTPSAERRASSDAWVWVRVSKSPLLTAKVRSGTSVGARRADLPGRLPARIRAGSRRWLGGLGLVSLSGLWPGW